jgi:hypothetical protein
LAAAFAVGIVAAIIGTSLAGRLPRGGHATELAHRLEHPEKSASEPAIATAAAAGQGELTR